MMNGYRVNVFAAFLLLSLMAVTVSVPAFASTTYTMKEGDTLWELSAKYYNDPTLYPIFLEVNNIDNPRMIPVGRVIVIPAYEDMTKAAQEVDPAKRQEMIKKLSSGSSSATTGSEPGNTSQQNVSAGEDADENKPIDPKSVSIMNVLGGKKVDTKKVKSEEVVQPSANR